MTTLRVLGWPLLFLGLVVAVLALLYLAVQDADLQRESFLASTRWNLAKAAELEQRREDLSARPVLAMGAALFALGIMFLEIRRRLANRSEAALRAEEALAIRAEEALAAGN